MALKDDADNLETTVVLQLDVPAYRCCTKL